MILIGTGLLIWAYRQPVDQEKGKHAKKRKA
jgi:hypothetical protein